MAIGLATNTVQTNGTSVSAGSDISGFTGKVVYDKGISQTPAPRVLKAQFGDGYEMRVRDGINNTPRTWALTFANRTKEDIDNLYAFFNRLASVDTCKHTVPDQTESGDEFTATVVIEEYQRTLSYDNYYTLTCSAREVFEP